METPLVEMAGYWQLITGVIITTIGWVTVTLITNPSKKETLESFDKLIFKGESKYKGFKNNMIAFLCGVAGVYALLFSVGNFLYGDMFIAFALLIITIASAIIIFKVTKN